MAGAGEGGGEEDAPAATGSGSIAAIWWSEGGGSEEDAPAAATGSGSIAATWWSGKRGRIRSPDLVEAGGSGRLVRMRRGVVWGRSAGFEF